MAATLAWNECEIMNITKENYRVSDLAFLNLRTNTIKLYNHAVYTVESMGIDEKVAIMDDFENGAATYMLRILSMYENERHFMPKGDNGEVLIETLQAFFDRNDPERRITIHSHIGEGYSYVIFGREYFKLRTTCPFDKDMGRLMYSRNHVVHQWFHDFLEIKRNEEQQWLDKSDDTN